MSACNTCKSLEAKLPQRVVIVVDGVTYVQAIRPDDKVADLQKACNYLLGLIDQAQAGDQRG